MPTWKETLQSLGDVLSDGFEGLSQTLKQRLHHDEPIQIVPYSGFGNQQLVKVSGRALEYKGEQQADEETLWSNLAHTYQRFESDEIASLRVQVTFQGQTLEVITDKEGYFEADLPVNETKVNSLWYDYQVDVPTQVLSPQLFKTVTGRVQIPSPQCDFGIISDIDDTIVVTNATSTLSMIRLTFLRSPASRLPFAGVSTFYQALTQGGSVPRPIFYVSSSPWNLYNFLEEFMELNKIPRGTLFLRDFGIHTLKASHHDHKAQYINQLMDTYPNLAFILIGDSGQHDPEVYSQIVSLRPHQVKAIYIRDVSSEESRDSEVLKLAEQTREQHIDLCLVSSTLEAATHAVSKGFMKPEILEQLKAELAQNNSAASKVEAAVGL